MIKRSTRVIFIKTKKLFDIYDIDADKTLISKKKNLIVEKAHLNTFLDIMMMSLDLYV